MAYTRTANPNNSTPFSSCCGVASMDADGKPDTKCHSCGKPMNFHDDSFSDRREFARKGKCRICGQWRGNPAIAGNCDC